MVAPDILVILADFFLRAGEISWTVVGGIYQDKLVVIFRNDGLRKNAGRLAVKAFGKLGSAGGHAASARAEVPLENTGMGPPAPAGRSGRITSVHRVESHGRLKTPGAGKPGAPSEDAASS